MNILIKSQLCNLRTPTITGNKTYITVRAWRIGWIKVYIHPRCIRNTIQNFLIAEIYIIASFYFRTGHPRHILKNMILQWILSFNRQRNILVHIRDKSPYRIILYHKRITTWLEKPFLIAQRLVDDSRLNIPHNSLITIPQSYVHRNITERCKNS